MLGYLQDDAVAYYEKSGGLQWSKYLALTDPSQDG
jgi:hypothetical protein